jgi:uncharacterized protein YdhG (YjbR/CyaY superfamily)
MAARFDTVEAYIATFPPDVQAKLESIRAAIRDAVPRTTEAISYDIPTFYLDGKAVVYFAGWKRHISLYPIPGGDPDLGTEIEPYKSGKGTLQFRLDRPIPLDLIGRVAAQLAREHHGPSR